MLKNTLAMLFGLGLTQLSFGATTDTSDALHLSGAYTCYGYDSHDGPYKDAALTLTLDTKDSDFANNYGAYHFNLTEPDGTVYLGEVAANGNVAAVYFQNTSASLPTDRGVGIAMITHDRDLNNKVTTVLHKFYYEPTYEGGGNGSETCIKQA